MGKYLEWVYIYRLEYKTGRDTHARIPVPAGFSGPILVTLGRNLTYSSPIPPPPPLYVGPNVYIRKCALPCKLHPLQDGWLMHGDTCECVLKGIHPLTQTHIHAHIYMHTCTQTPHTPPSHVTLPMKSVRHTHACTHISTHACTHMPKEWKRGKRRSKMLKQHHWQVENVLLE